MSEVSWHGYGFETGRGYDRANFKADTCDLLAVLSPARWQLGDEPSGPTWKRWAVEFPSSPGRYVRRGFWAETTGNVRESMIAQRQLGRDKREAAAVYRARKKAEKRDETRQETRGPLFDNDRNSELAQ